jgi:hypothetical protein
MQVDVEKTIAEIKKKLEIAGEVEIVAKQSQISRIAIIMKRVEE